MTILAKKPVERAPQSAICAKARPKSILKTASFLGKALPFAG